MTGPERRPTWRDAYDTQMAVWRWLRTERGIAHLKRHLAYNSGETQYPETKRLLARLYASEEQRVMVADPVFVSAEMCELTTAASATFAPEPLLRTDIITPLGFLVYETPADVLDRFEAPLNIAGLSWGPIITADEDVDARERPDLLESWGDGDGDGIGITVYANLQRLAEVSEMTLTWGPPPLVPVHVTPWYFGMEHKGNEVDEHGKPTGAGWWWKLAQATFRLMQQQISVHHTERPDKGQRREATRRGFPERETLVVRLRREKGEHETSGDDANYSHRFIVSGHWRNAYYPSINGHRQIWISPYVKGPAHLPLRVKPRRAFQWTR